MTIWANTFRTQLDGLRPSIKELASGLHLRVNTSINGPIVDHLTCCQRCVLMLIIDDVAPPDTLAPLKARLVTFFARLLEGLGRAGAANSFTVLQRLKEGDDIISRPDPTSTSLWEQVEAQAKAQANSGPAGLVMLELQQAI